MVNFPIASLANHSPNNTVTPIISQDSHLHIVNWPHDILRLVGRLLPRKDAISFTSTCVLLFTLRYKAGGHGIIYEQFWKRVPGPQEAICSTLSLEDRTTIAWPVVKNYASAISALTLNFGSSYTHDVNEDDLTSVIKNLKNLTNLITLNIACSHLQNRYTVALLTAIAMFEFSKLRNLTINAPFYTFTTLPAELGQLQCLQSLTINAPYLTTLPAELGQLQCLQSLTINAPYLTTLPAELGQLQRLQNLTIHAYNLSALPSELGQLRRLRSLAIEALRLTTFPPELGQLQRLQSLHITINRSCVFLSEIDQLEKRGVKVTRATY